MKIEDLAAPEPQLDGLFVNIQADDKRWVLEEGKWMDGRFKQNIRQDRNTHLQSGDTHYHVYGRRGDEIGAINCDGTISHGGDPFRLHPDDADALRQLGVKVPPSNIVEWIVMGPAVEFLLG